MFDRRRPTTLRERLEHDGWSETARAEVDRARRGAVQAGDVAWKQARVLGGRAQKEAARARKRLSKAMPKQRARRERRRRVLFLTAGTAVGAAIAYLFDPDEGRGRRTRLRDRTAGAARRLRDRGERLGRRVASDAEGLTERARHRNRDYAPPNDVTLARKVESEVLGRPEIPAGAVLVNAESGVVVLRGQVERPDLIGEIEHAVRRVDGVRDVDNLLHVPGQPAPNKAEIRGG